MSVQRRTRTRTAFQFWDQVLKSWDGAPECAGQYAELIKHLLCFQTRIAHTFKQVIERGAGPPMEPDYSTETLYATVFHT